MVAGTVGGLAVLLGGGFAAYRMYDYVEHDPRFCRSCHLMETAYAKWQASAHAGVGCRACHVQSTRENLDQLIKYVTLRPDEVGKHADVDYTRCGACHLSRDPKWKQVAQTAGHEAHFTRRGLECVGCHSKGVHQFVRPVDSCKDCHLERVQEGGMTALHCTACHEFLAADHELGAPTRSDCLACHANLQVGSERFEPHAPMRFPCQGCHRPHENLRPTPADCVRCHHVADFGLHAVPFHDDCRSCHAPHLWRVDARATCEGCHTDRKEHYPDAPCAGCHSFTKSERAP